MLMSRVPSFYKLPMERRIGKIKKICNLDGSDLKLLGRLGSLEDFGTGENVIGCYEKPLRIATNFLINRADYIIPMVTEEPSVVAAASNGAKLARYHGGFMAYPVSEPRMIAQVQLTEIKDLERSMERIIENKGYILDATTKEYRKKHEHCKVVDLEVREVKTPRGKMILNHLIVDTENSMGANAVNEMAEIAAPYLEKLANAKASLRIVSNLADKSLFRTEAKIPKAVLKKDGWSGEEVAEGILDADALACNDIYSATTRNKGILNVVCAVAEATGNDYRALEAGAHAYASIGGYKPLSRWFEEGDYLIGKLEMPITVGTVGGSTAYPKSKLSLKILGVGSSKELGEVIASVGLANNLAALRELVTEGIQRGHMEIHRETYKN
jgi:hydroxymethylglutaryl-CoA reductase